MNYCNHCRYRKTYPDGRADDPKTWWCIFGKELKTFGPTGKEYYDEGPLCFSKNPAGLCTDFEQYREPPGFIMKMIEYIKKWRSNAKGTR